MLGAGLIACGSVMWALFSVLLQPYTTRAHPIHLSSITMASGAAFLLLVATPALQRLDVHTVSMAEWGAVAYAGIGALVIAYLLFYHGVRVLGATRTSMYGNLQPLIAILVAWVMLSERPTGWQALGAAFIMGGLVLSRLTMSHPSTSTVPSHGEIPDEIILLTAPPATPAAPAAPTAVGQ
jgi:drug/metabolite transporter (DMT)-like permease